MDFFIISQYHFGRLVLPGTTCQSARTFFRGALVLIALVATRVIEGLRKRFEFFRRSRFRSLASNFLRFPICDIRPGMPEITRILQSLERGDAQAADELLPLVYKELRRLAAHKMSLQPPGQTLQATALVHEAYLRLVGNEEKRWENRRHFFGAAAEAMRHILIDRARRRLRVRHGEKEERVLLDEIEIAAPAREEIVLQLDEDLEKLAEISLGQAEIV